MTPNDLRRIRVPSSLRMPKRMVIPERFSAPLLPARPYGRNLWLLLWILVLIAAAQVVLFVKPIVGVYVDAAVFASLIWLALWQERSRQFVISTAIIPLSMLLCLSLPASTVFTRTSVLMVSFLLLALVYQYLFTLEYPTDGTRLRMTRHGYLFAIPLMVVFGQFLGLVGYGLLRHQYDFADTPLPLVALGVIVFAIAEEILFRGLIQQKAMELFHPLMAAALSAGLYTLVSFGHRGGGLSPVFAALLGSAVAYVYYKKQNILLTIAINVATKLTYTGLVAIFVLRH